MSMDTSFTPKSLTAPEYVRALFEPADNAAILVRNRKSGKIIQRIARAETIASPEFQEWLAAQSVAGADVYVSMNPIKDGAYSRTKDHIKDIRHVYLDLDRTGDASLEAIRNSTTVPPPNFVLHTSPGKHQVIWKVSGFSQEEAESVLHKLANQFGGDMAATDSTRVLRLPGFANHKLPQEFIVQGRQESNGIYSRRAFTIDEGTPESPRHLSENDGRSHVLHADHKSQSERDWAYAMRALGRGLTPEEVMRDIAEFRADDKYDPTDYARRTVTKAQAELKNASTLEIPGSVAGDESRQDRTR
jgi:hypothetical protein